MAASRSVEQELLAGDTGFRPVERESLDGNPALPGKPVSGPAERNPSSTPAVAEPLGETVEIIVAVRRTRRPSPHPSSPARRRSARRGSKYPMSENPDMGHPAETPLSETASGRSAWPILVRRRSIATPAHRKERDERGTAFTALCDPHDRATCPPARPPKVGDFPRALIASVGRHPWEVDGHPPRVSGTACQLPP